MHANFEAGNAQAHPTSGLTTNQAGVEQLEAQGFYTATLIRDGKVVWEEDFKNLVTTQGKNDLLDKYFAGSGYTAAFYMGLVKNTPTPAYAAGDTPASHAGWAESTSYSNASRPTVAWGAAAAGSKASTATVFNINADDTISGCFIATNSAKGGTSGLLYSVGAFTGGDRVVRSGDTLSVTWTGSV